MGSICKKEPVDVLCKTVRGIQEAQVKGVKGNAAEYHITLQNLVSVPSAVALPQIFFRLMQIERGKMQVAGHSCVQSSLIGFYLVRHP